VVTFHTEVEEFVRVAGPFLEAREAENNLMLGAVGRMSGSVGSMSLVTVERDGAVVGAAMWTPPFHLVLTEMDFDAVRELVDDADARGLDLPGVHGPVETSAAFARLWEERRSVVGTPHHNERIYRLDRVIEPAPVPGRFRVATGDDLEIVAEWIVAFMADIGRPAPIENARVTAADLLAEERIYLWENSVPVSMAAWSGRTPNGVRINYVYTPPRERRNGYASAVVAGLSRLMLESGRRYCFLFTDLSNPTSNSIYMKIGYRPVCDIDLYRFESRG